MIFDDIRNIKSGKKELRTFGLTIGAVLALIGAFLLWKHREGELVPFILSGVFVLSGLIFPVILKPFQKVWMGLAVILGWIMTRVILILVFYVIFVPIGVISRLFGKKFLDIGWKNTGKDTYWIEKKAMPPDKSRYENQF